jgi:dUTP pyrophosphatase
MVHVNETLTVHLQRLDAGLPLPAYAHPGDAGADLLAAEDVELAPGERVLVRTGVAIALPDGYVGLVHPRSGLAARLGVTVLNAPGTVDAGYRGEILVNLVNHDRVITAKISRGDRIAQLVIQRVERADFVVVEELPETRRGAGGHGSTGGHAGLIPAQHQEEQ